MGKKNVIFDETLEQYRKKYHKHQNKLLKISKKEVEDFDKKISSTKKGYLLEGHKWSLIGDTYYEVPKTSIFTWFKNLNCAAKIGVCSLLVGSVATVVLVPTLIVYNINKIDLDFKVTLSSSDSTIISHIEQDGSIKAKVVSKDNKKFVKTLSIKKGDYSLKEDEFTFDKTSGELIINSDVARLHRGDVVITPTIIDIAMESIVVGEMPTKTNYEYSELLDFAGLKILGVMNNGSKVDVTADCTTSPESGTILMDVGQQEVLVQHKNGMETKFIINGTKVKCSTQNINIDNINPGRFVLTSAAGYQVTPDIDTPNADVITFRSNAATLDYAIENVNSTATGKGGSIKLKVRDIIKDYYDFDQEIELASFSKVKIIDNKVSALSIGESSGNIILPSKYWDINKKAWVVVDTIPDNAFKNCVNLTGITIPSTIKTIGTDAFKGCTRLVDVCFENDTIASYSSKDQFQGLLDNVVSVKILQSGDERINYPYFDSGEATTGLYNTTSTSGVTEFNSHGEKGSFKYHYYEKITSELKEKLVYSNKCFNVDATNKLTTSTNNIYIPNYFHRTIDEKDVVAKVFEIGIRAFKDIARGVSYLYLPNQMRADKIPGILSNLEETGFSNLVDMHLPNANDSVGLPNSAFLNNPVNSLFIYRNYKLSGNGQFKKFYGYINLTDFALTDNVFPLTKQSFEIEEEGEEVNTKGLIVGSQKIKNKYLENAGIKDLVDNCALNIYVEGEQP